VPDKLISQIIASSRILVAVSSLGQRAFSIDCLLESDGEAQGLSLGRPFAGVDDRLWGIIGVSSLDIKTHGEYIDIQIKNLSVNLSRISSASGEQNNLISINELIFNGYDGRSLRFFGDTDEFEVPCINCELTGNKML
jgi:hypothetical protein